jgi:hypothetical protein
VSFAAPVVNVASAARTTSGNSGAIGLVDAGGQLALLVNVTAASGTTPSMTLTVQWSHDGTNFADNDTAADTFTAITTTKTTVKTFPIKAPFYRVAWAITGTTPSFTFTVSSYLAS